MKAAIDTNILVDLLAGDSAASHAAEQTLSSLLASGAAVICPVVHAEMATGFERPEELSRFLHDFGIRLEAFSPEALSRAAAAWSSCVRLRGRQVQCPTCGHTFDLRCPSCQSPIAWRQHIISDFLVGGHASAQADLLVTRDAGYFRRFFPELRLVVPPATVPPASG